MIGKTFREKATAVAEIPNQIRTMTITVVVVGIVSVIALFLAAFAVRYAD